MASASDQLASSINLAKFAQATDLKKRLWFTLGALIVFRMLSRPRAACSTSSTTSPAARSTACRSSRSA
jgi:preprotein translocase subunit SecY